MTRPNAIALSITLGLLASGCGTIQSWNGDRDAPHYFSGTRLNVATLTGDQSKLSDFRDHGVNPLPDPYALLDVPTSLVADVLMLPIALCASIDDVSLLLPDCFPYK